MILTFPFLIDFLETLKNGNKPTNSSTNNQTQKNLFIVQKEEIETPKIKREPIPPIFSIDEINKIKLYIMGSKLKSKLLLPKETNSKDIELIKEELEAESFRGRKKLKININLTENIQEEERKWKTILIAVIIKILLII